MVKSISYSSAARQQALLHACMLLGLPFDPEDVDGMFLENNGSLSPNYMVLYRRR
jgi:hypothetical protein